MSEAAKVPELTHSTDKVIDVTITIRAKVTVTDDFRKSVPKFVDDNMKTDEQIAEGMVYASFWHYPETWQRENSAEDDWWDGGGNMKGLINDIKLDTVEAD